MIDETFIRELLKKNLEALLLHHGSEKGDLVKTMGKQKNQHHELKFAQKVKPF